MDPTEKINITEGQIRAALRKWCIIDLIANEIVKDLKGADHATTH